KVLGNIGFCAMHLERDGEAIDAYSAYIRDVPDISDRERTQIQRDLATLSATTVNLRVTLKSHGTAPVLLDKRSQTRGPPVENAYPIAGTELTVRVRPGRHTLILKDGDASSVPRDFTLDPGSSVSHEFVLAPKEAPVASQPRAQRSPSLAGPAVLGG